MQKVLRFLTDLTTNSVRYLLYDHPADLVLQPPYAVRKDFILKEQSFASRRLKHILFAPLDLIDFIELCNSPADNNASTSETQPVPQPQIESHPNKSVIFHKFYNSDSIFPDHYSPPRLHITSSKIFFLSLHQNSPPMAPLFSIITVCYNACSQLKKTIESVDSQSCNLYEHIIIDGASVDGTHALLKSAVRENRIIVSEPDNGIYDAMNKGLGLAKGDYVIFLNAGDCFSEATTLQRYADAIFDNDYPGIVYGQTQLVDNNGDIVGQRHLSAPRHLTLKSFANGMLVCHQAMAVLRRITSLYNLKYKYSADFDWVIKCLMHSKNNVYINHIVCDYLYEGATTAHHKASLIERFSIMCHYYGCIPTLFRHFKFALRFLKHRSESDKTLQ